MKIGEVVVILFAQFPLFDILTYMTKKKCVWNCDCFSNFHLRELHFRNPRIITLSAHNYSVSFECMVYTIQRSAIVLVQGMVKFVTVLIYHAGTNFTESRADLCK